MVYAEYSVLLLTYDAFINQPQTLEHSWEAACTRLGDIYKRLSPADQAQADALQKTLYLKRIKA